jgi:hypothetical protein
LAQFDLPLGKAVEGHRTPRRCAQYADAQNTRSVLDCASPLALCKQMNARKFSHKLLCANNKMNCYIKRKQQNETN